ncbi:NBAS [Lepeophtheirus salmonis]|uniref:NBAS n=1 Tax=Lepeophtheirus salmonis TaxID=72036 RepID=A0A7R8D3D7_LEPSM|nr:NBAS [Lepeophtheirus salmonis]CAF3016236.1 NBAS [Lepeophtheirus salmonis]
MESNAPLLYDLLEIKEWDPVEEEVKVATSSSFSLLNFVPGLGRGTTRNLNGVILPSWEIVISRDETRLAVLSNSFLEIYSVPQTLIGRSKCFDEPVSRQVVWSQNSDYILIPSDNGKKFFSLRWFLCTSHIPNFFPIMEWNNFSYLEKEYRFSLEKTGFQEFANISFGVKDVCCAVHTKKYKLNVIAYWDPSHSLYVLGVWRPLNEEPYFQKVDTHTEGADVHPILKMSLSHSEQPLFDEINPSLLQDPKLVDRKNDFLNSSVKWHPYQVEWWDNDAVIISRFSGSVSIITVEANKESKNLLGDSVEFFADIPCITRRFGRYIFCLERDYEETRDNEVNEPIKKSWPWSFSDKNKNKHIISNYRLIAMVKMTPEELYQRKIDKEEYGEALVLSEVFSLDSDLVYLRSEISTIIRECLDTVPNNIHDAKELLQFGLKSVQAEEIINHDYEKKFQKYIKLLKTYERLIRSFNRQDIKFNSQFFIKFRDTTIKKSIQNFAQLGYWDSIRVLFEMHFEEISDDYIDLISSIPESYSPLEYSFILPFADLKTKNVIYPFGNSNSNLNGLSFDALQNWYKSRSSAIEKATGLPDNSIDLLDFAKIHGVDIEEEYYLDLITLRTLIYDLGKSDLNYTIFKKMSNAEKGDVFILCDNSKEKVLVSPRIQEYLIPFLELQNKINDGSYNTILKDYFSRSRPRDIVFDKEIIFNLPERKIKDPDFISLCLNSLFRLNDDYDTLCEILLLFMEHSNLNILHEIIKMLSILILLLRTCVENTIFLQHIENPELASKALDDIFTICKSNLQIDLNQYFKSTLTQLLRSENNKIVHLIVECLECFPAFTMKKCESCFYHKALKNYDLMDLTLVQKKQILLSTAEYYLEESNFIGDHNVSLAEVCLKKLSPEDKQVKNLRNVLRVGYHLNDFSIQASPSYINNSENSKCIIRDILTKNKKNYKKHSDILQIASCLSSEDRFLRETEEMIAETSLEAEDIRRALVMVKNMIQYSYEPAAKLCFDILQCAPHLSIEDRQLLNNFCLQFGEPLHVLSLLDELEECSKRQFKDSFIPQESSHLKFQNFGPIHKSSINSWINNLMGYDILGAISLMSSVMGDTHWNEDKDGKNYLFIKAYVASIQAFSSSLRQDILLVPPKILISAAIEESRTVKDHPIEAVMSKFNNYIEARRLYDVDANIDVVRFVNEETYKLDTIMGLSMSSDVHKSLKILKENPHKLLQNLKKYIYQSLDGKDYESMLMYFRFLFSFELISESELKQYKKLIMKSKALCTSSFQMDLKEVLGDSDAFSKTIKSIIESSSLEKIISLTEVLNKINPNANTGLIYQSLCERYFESGRMSKGLSIEQIFEQCEEYFKKMSIQQLKEFVITVSFKSRNISLDFRDREVFLMHLKENFVVEKELNSEMDVWIQHNTNLRGLDEEIHYSPEDFLGSESPKISTLESILTDYDLINDEDEIEKIHRFLIDWCMKEEHHNQCLDIKDVVINFVRNKSDDQNALDAVSLHKSRLILANKFSNVDNLLPNLNNKADFLHKMMTEANLTPPHNVSAILELVTFWEEQETEYIEIKSDILKFISKQKIGQSFSQDLHKFSLHHLSNIKEILAICYENKEFKFAFDILKHCSATNKEMKDTVQGPVLNLNESFESGKFYFLL